MWIPKHRQPQDLTGWVLIAEEGNQQCSLGGGIEPGATLRLDDGRGREPRQVYLRVGGEHSEQ